MLSRIGVPRYSPKQDLWKRNLLFQDSDASVVLCPACAFGGYPFGFVISAGTFCMNTACPVKEYLSPCVKLNWAK